MRAQLLQKMPAPLVSVAPLGLAMYKEPRQKQKESLKGYESQENNGINNRAGNGTG